MGEGFQGQVILGWPSSRSDLDKINAALAPQQRFHPTVEHSLSTCDGCERGIWIGPNQQQLVDSPFVRAHKMCILCIGHTQRVLGLRTQAVNVNLDIGKARRRTA